MLTARYSGGHLGGDRAVVANCPFPPRNTARLRRDAAEALGFIEGRPPRARERRLSPFSVLYAQPDGTYTFMPSLVSYFEVTVGAAPPHAPGHPFLRLVAGERKRLAPEAESPLAGRAVAVWPSGSATITSRFSPRCRDGTIGAMGTMGMTATAITACEGHLLAQRMR
jgi:hypothetical protein